MSVNLVKKIEDYKLDILEHKVNEICKPLFDSTPISFFEYNVSFLDGSRITITSNANWVYEYYNSNYYRNGMHHRKVDTYKQGFNFWNSVGRTKVTDLAREKYNIDNGFTIIEPGDGFCEFYHFASKCTEVNLLNFYFSQLNDLYRFIAYFKSEGSKTIDYYSKNKIICKYIESEDLQNPSHSSQIFDAQKLFPVNKFYFFLNNNFEHLTNREIEISLWLLKGKSAEEIGIILDISKRTVETYIERMKNKLCCYKQTHLITKLIEIGLWRLLSQGHL